MKLKLIGYFVLLSLLSFNLSAQKADVVLKLKAGDVYTVQMDMINAINQEMMGQKIQMDQKMMMTLDMRVIEKLSGGNYKMEQQYSRIRMNMTAMGQNIDIDTEGERNEKNDILHKMKEITFGYEVSPKGEISNVTGYEKLVSIMGNNPQAAQMLKGIANEEMVKNFFQYIPQNKVKVGDVFSSTVKMQAAMGVEVETKYTVEKITKQQMDLNVSSDFSFSPDNPMVQNGMSIKMNGSGVQKGDFAVNLKDGMPTISTLTQDMEMNMSFENPQSGEDMTIPMKLKSDVKTSVTKK